MVKSPQLLLAAALAALIALPGATAAAAPQTVTLSGTYSSVHEDALGTFAEQDRHYLQTADARYELQFTGQAALEGETGADVTVTGRLAGDKLIVGSGKGDVRIRRQGPLSAVTVGAATAAEGGTTGTSGTTSTGSSSGTVAPMTAGGAVATATVAAVLINFTDLATQPFTASQTAAALYGTGVSAKTFFEEESKGRMSLTGAVFGWYTIPAASTGCNWSDWVAKGTAAANAAGANLSGFTNLMFIFPSTAQCSFAGLGYVPGTTTLLNGTLSVQVMTHELGHNFGLGHANAVSCSVNGTRVSLSTAVNCTEQTYADPFGTMGNNALRHNPASQLGELGWLADTEKVVGAPGHTYTITPYFSGGGVHLVRIPRGDGSFFDLDFRMPYGVIDTFAAGSPAVTGAMIRLGWGTASPTNNPLATQLIDTTPATATLADAPLGLGRMFTDPVSTISFTTVAVSSLAVQVRVTEGVAPTTPGAFAALPAADGTSVALTWAAASDNVAVASYVIARNGSTVATLGADAGSWTDPGVDAGATYTYTIAAVDTSGNASPAATASVNTPVNPDAPVASPPVPTSAPAAPTAPPAPVPAPPAPAPADTQAPTAPQPLSASAGLTTVSLRWGASTDDTAVAGYAITRNGSPVATVTGTSWTDTGRSPRTAYTYTVTALDTGANRSAATSVRVTTARDATAPTVPRNFRRTAQAGRYVTFAWSRSGDNVGVARYEVYRVGVAAPVARTTRLAVTIRTVRGATYDVRAVDTSGNRSGASVWVRIRF